MVITVGGIKGGSGKTTVATNLVIYLSLLGKDVLLVDADEQQTATDFTSWREVIRGGDVGYTSVQLMGDTVRSQVQKLATKYDYVVIDTGGRDTMSQRAALASSDMCLLPFHPRSFDLWTVGKMEALVKEIRSIKSSPLLAYSFLNRADARGADNEASAGLLSSCDELTYLPFSLGNRKVFSHASSQGLSILEVAPFDEKAVQELKQLVEFIIA